MAEKRSRVVVEILGDAKGLSGATAEADSALGRLGSSLRTVGAAMARYGAIATGVAAVAGFRLANAASDLNEALSKSNTVFGESAKAVEEWSRTAATSVGLSQTEALNALGTFGNMFDQLGIASEESAKLSKEMVSLAADFGSFHNADITEVIEAQSAAFRGEYDSLQRFLPLISAATVEARALELANKSSTKELTAQEKALAVQALMMEGAGAAMGDFARTSGGFANQQRILRAQFENIKVQLGTLVLPAFSRLAWVLNTSVIPSVSSLVEMFRTRGLGGVLEELWAAVMRSPLGGLARELEAAFGWVQRNRDGIIAALSGIGVVLGYLFAAAAVKRIQAFAQAFMLIAPALLRFAGWAAAIALVVYGLRELYQRSERFREVVRPLIDILGVLRDVASDVAAGFREGGLSGAFRALVDSMAEHWPQIWGLLKEFGTLLWSWIRESGPPTLRAIGEWFADLGRWLWNDGLPMLADFAARAGRALWEWIREAVPAAGRQLGEWLGALGRWITGSALPAIGRFATSALTAITGWIADATAALPGRLGEFAGRVAGWLITEGVPAVVRGAIELRSAILGWVSDAIRDVPGLLARFVGAVASWASGDGRRAIANVGEIMGNILRAPIEFAINAIKSFWNSTIGGRSISLPKIDLPGPLPDFGGASFSIPKLAEGGIVSSATLALIGEAGPEAVVPLPRMGEFAGSRSVTVNVYPARGDDGQAVIAAIQRAERVTTTRWRTGSRPVAAIA